MAESDTKRAQGPCGRSATRQYIGKECNLKHPADLYNINTVRAKYLNPVCLSNSLNGCVNDQQKTSALKRYAKTVRDMIMKIYNSAAGK
jgi:hypothetical protein